MTSTTERLDETSTELLAALETELANAIETRSGGTEVTVECVHTGGGVFVASVILDDLPGHSPGRAGREVWLTRDADAWLIGVYDFEADPEDEGLCVTLTGRTALMESPLWVASQVVGILKRLRVV